jgi:fumarylacetoacetate (FAA) hydrolase
LGSLRGPGRDGTLVVVSRDLSRALAVPDVAPTLQAALDGWAKVEGTLGLAYAALNDDARFGFALAPGMLGPPLPRAYQWLDSSAYVHHIELVRKARGAEMPPSFWTDPVMYQGGSDSFLGPTDPIPAGEAGWGTDFEAEIAAIVDDVPLGADVARAAAAIRLFVLVNDVSLRGLIPAELAKGFGFVQSKPSSALSPVAVTPDELGDAWDGARIHRPLEVRLNGAVFGSPDAGTDMTFSYAELIAYAARTRRLTAGSLVGAGTVSNRDAATGSCCIAERRMLETIATGEAGTPYLARGDRVRIEMATADGCSIFGAIDQGVV